MRANLLCGRGGVSHLIDEDTRHSLPIGQMGNYQDYLKKQPMPLRELESAPVRQHMFGNPFKTNKNLMMMTDEVSGLGGVDEVQIVGPGTPQQVHRGVKRAADQVLSAPPKRRKGPLARDFQFPSPVASPAASPVHIGEIPEIELNPEPIQINHKLPIVNGIKSVGKMASYFKDVVENFEDPGLQLIEQVKSISKEENIQILNHKNDFSRNHILKTSKLDISKNDFTKSVADNILSTMTEVQESSLKAWLPNGQPEAPPPYRKLDLIPPAPTEIIELEPTPPPIHVVTDLTEDDRQTAPVVSPEPILAKQVKEKKLTPEEIRSIKLRNNNVRQLIYKEVKRPGKLHCVLWRMLGELHGPPDIRKQFILEVKQEAVRYVIRTLGCGTFF